MIEVGGKPLLWHIMKMYERYGIKDFVVCLGYRGDIIKQYFVNYHMLNSNVTVDLLSGETEVHEHSGEPWKVSLIDTGLHTMTGGRLRKIQRFVQGETFCMTYGDGLSDVDVGKVIEFHRRAGRLATVTAVEPPGRFGVLNLNEAGTLVKSFTEKPQDEIGSINGGFFVLEPGALDYTSESDDCIWEKAPMERLAADGQLAAYRHPGFWQPCDTLRDKQVLEKAWERGAPWLGLD